MNDTYTGEDARFDAEASGRCGICGREPFQCGHCRECGGHNFQHTPTCSGYAHEHTVTDTKTGRTFLLNIRGKDLIDLQQQTPSGDFVEVPYSTPDGADWWEQWEGEIRAGTFNHKETP